jgi:hypothetical protein
MSFAKFTNFLQVYSSKMRSYGFILSIIGEILIVAQALLFYLVVPGISEEPVTYVVLIALPAFLFDEFMIKIADIKKIRGLGGFFYFILLGLASVSMYFGGGWYFGFFYLLIGGCMRIVAR